MCDTINIYGILFHKILGEFVMGNYAIILLIWNIIVMFIYGIDKLLAKTGKRRVRELSLLVCAFLLGGIGAMFGMVLFNHKTSKIKFRILVPMSFVIGIAVMFWGVKTFCL